MTKRRSVVLALLCIVAMFTNSAFAEQEAMITFSNKQRALGISLLKSSKEQGNRVLSPLSIHAALMLARSGATGDTANELDKVLFDATFSPELLNTFKNFQTLIQGERKNVLVRGANSIWMNVDVSVKPKFETLASDVFSASVTSVDFSKSEETRKIINQWVSTQTKNLIPELIPQNGLSPQSIGALVNALYFKAPWASPFDEGATLPDNFHVSASETVSVPMMQTLETLPWYEDDLWSAIRMPYENGDFSMAILLPKERLSAKELLNRMSPKLVAELLARSKDERVIVKMPKFSIRSPMELRTALEYLGIKQLFSSEAKLDQISNEPLMITDVLHEGFIEVNEHGTEAAAATALMVARSAAFATTPKYFTADHPFMFMVLHESSGAPLFMGVVNKP
jgi:serpin B